MEQNAKKKAEKEAARAAEAGAKPATAKPKKEKEEELDETVSCRCFLTFYSRFKLLFGFSLSKLRASLDKLNHYKIIE